MRARLTGGRPFRPNYSVARYVVPRLATKRKCFVTDIVPTQLATYGALSFKLDNLPAFTEITSLFQAYRINGIKLDFIPIQNDAAAGSSTNGFPMMHYIIDHDDIAPPTTFNEVFQYDNVRYRRCDRPWSVFFKPKVLSEAYQLGVTQAYGYARRMWLSTTYPAVQHYGFKWYLDSPNIMNNFVIKVCATYYIEAKSTR